MKSSWTRRRFTAVAARAPIVVAVAASTWGCVPNSADKAAPAALTARENLALQRVAYRLFPYPDAGPEPYERVAAAIASAVETDPATAALVTGGLASLDELQQRPWLELDESGQVAVLESIDGGPFFSYLLDTTRSRLFNDRAIWARIGYDPGLPFNDIDWLGDA